MNVLLVEDYLDLQHAIRDHLRRHEHHVLALESAEHVDAALMRQSVDVALVDLILPGEDGLSLVRRLRHSHPGMGIIVISGRNSTLDRVNSYHSGADLYLAKPVIYEELLAALEALGRRLTERSAKALPAPGDCTLLVDSQSLEVRGPQGSARLTTTEFALLKGLTRARDGLLETPTIYQMLGREEGRKAALEALVYRVRRKLAQAGAGERCIRAHRLKGYQLFCPVRIV